MAPPLAKADSADESDYPLVGETLGLWRLVRGLGRGGMGEVYEGEYDFVNLLSLRYPAESRGVIEQELRQLSRPEQARLASEMLGTTLSATAHFAIKVCNARSATAGHKRFLQEAELAQRLGDHPYIVTVHALNAGGLSMPGADLARFALERGRFRDISFMVMDLAVRSYDHTKLSLAESVHVVRCIATALDHAHAQGIVHRDLKPENILGDVEHPLLTDFGIAKELDHSDGLTRTGQVIGTLDYMSPEQATDAKRVDHRSDIYSLGVVLYEMSTQGCLPYFHKADRDSCLTAIRSEGVEPKWPREYVRDFPVGLERIILKAMAYRQEDRYQAMSEFIGDLDRWTRGDWISPIGRVGAKGWIRYQGRRHPRLMWGSGAAGVLLVILVIWLGALPFLDSQRRALDAGLDRLDLVVRQVEAGQLSQPSSEDRKVIEDLDTSLRLAGDRYPEQQKRRNLLRTRLLANRWLSVRFGGLGPGGLPVTGEEVPAALDQLTAATGAKSADWYVEGNRGLVMQERTKLVLGPYGTGRVTILLQVQARDAATLEGLALHVKDSGDFGRNQHLWRVKDGLLQQFYRMDEQPAQLLDQAPVVTRVVVDAEFTGLALRLTQPRAVEHPVPGLSQGAPAMVEIDLPRDCALVALEIRPRK